MTASAEIHGLLLDLWEDLHSIKILWQVGVLLACIGMGQAVAGWLAVRRTIRAWPSSSPLEGEGRGGG